MTSDPGRPLVTVVIPSFHDWEGVGRCLDAIAAQTYPPELIRAVVVNNDPHDPPPSGLAERLRLARAHILTEPRGGSYAARNLGVATARSDVIAFTDADCIPDRMWIEAAVRAISNGTDRVAGHVEVLTGCDRIGHAALHEVSSAFDQRRYVRRGFGATANLVVRRTAFDQVGPFDARLRSGGDIEWNQRAGRAGFTLRYVAEARVAHPARTSAAALLEKDARVWAGKLAIEEFPRPVLAVGALLQGIVPPVLPLVRAGLRARRRPRVGLLPHLFWLWGFRLRRALQRIRLTVRGTVRETPDAGSVVIAVGSLVGGGAERSSLLIARHWPDDHPLRPRLMVRELSGPFVAEIAEGLPVDAVGSTRTLRIPIFLWQVRRAVRRHAVRAIISNSPRMSDVLLIGRRLRIIPCPIVVVERSGHPEISRREQRSRRSAARYVRSSAAITICVSEGVAMRVSSGRDYGSTPTVVVRNAAAVATPGASSEQHASPPGARPRFAAVGRLEAVKNHRLLIDAFHAIPSGLRGSLVILGEGALRPALEAQVRELGLADAVSLPGFVREPWDVLRQCDVFVLSSDFEGHPRVLMEALLCGLRVVATDCPTGPREIIEGVTGTRLVPPRDRAAVQAAMTELAREALGGSPARDRDEEAALAERFDPGQMARRYASVVDGVLA